jgi:hypothetical protein
LRRDKPYPSERLVFSVGGPRPEATKAHIDLPGAEPPYSEIRVDNKLETSDGKPAELRTGSEVQVTIAAGPDSTITLSSR